MLGKKFFQIFKLSKLFVLFIFFIFFTETVSAESYTVYVDASVTDNYTASSKPDCQNYNTSTFVCSGGSDSVYVSARDVRLFLDSLSTNDTATVYYRKGQTWAIDASNERPRIDTHNVTLTSFGSGARPILDGKNTNYGGENGYPIITVTGGITNITINGLEIKNSYSSGIGLQGNSSSAGDVTITNCSIHDVGWSALNGYGWQNAIGTVTFKNNEVYTTGKYPKTYGGHWPSSIASVNMVAQHNVVRDVYGEGITCAGGDCTIEYNNVSDIAKPSIYMNPWIGPTKSLGTVVVGYNLVWNDTDETYTSEASPAIRLDDEDGAGDNRGSDISIYGNIVIGYRFGIDLRNNPVYGSDTYSNWGTVKVYENTLIDNKENIKVVYNDRFNSVILKNNSSIIHSDAESACKHVSASGSSWSGWTWGANDWYGDINPGFPYTTSGEFGIDPELGKTSGWRRITSAPSLSDFNPTIGSVLIKIFNNEETSLSPPAGLSIKIGLN